MREAIPTVMGRLMAAGLRVDRDTLSGALKTLTTDPDTWVRIKAERSLGLPETAAKFSPLGNACFGLQFALQQNWPDREVMNREYDIQRRFRAKIRRRIEVPQPGGNGGRKVRRASLV